MDTVYSPTEQVGEYTVLRILGEGRYGICYLVSKDNKQYILKQLKRNMLKKIGHKANYEPEILKTLNHKRIPKFIEKLEYDKFLGYILELKEGKTLEEIIFIDNYVFSKEEIFNIAIQLIDILKYLHGKGIVHRDIRVPNVLYNLGEIHLVDFGLARWVNEDRYVETVDFSYFGDFLLHLLYTAYNVENEQEKPWYEELDLPKEEMIFLKRLLGMEEVYKDINQVENELLKIKQNIKNKKDLII
ncbi:MAG: protein kinase [Bacillota bacterium]|nr:protein kinase [Bacillota bacterium]